MVTATAALLVLEREEDDDKDIGRTVGTADEDKVDKAERPLDQEDGGSFVFFFKVCVRVSNEVEARCMQYERIIRMLKFPLMGLGGVSRRDAKKETKQMKKGTQE